MNKILIPLILASYMLCLNTTLNGQQNKEITQNAEKSDLPVATICGVYSGLIEKDTLMKADSLICSWNNYEIISFTMFRIADELNSNSNLLTEEMKKSIREMRSGHKISFFDIKAKSPDGKIISLSPIILKIK